MPKLERSFGELLKLYSWRESLASDFAVRRAAPCEHTVKVVAKTANMAAMAKMLVDCDVKVLSCSNIAAKTFTFMSWIVNAHMHNTKEQPCVVILSVFAKCKEGSQASLVDCEVKLQNQQQWIQH